MISRKTENRIFKSKNDLLFYVLMAAFPVIQVILFYFFVNGNAVMLSFKKYDAASDDFFWTMQSLTDAFALFTTEKAMLVRLGNSLIMYGISLIVILPFSLFFSFYIYKKKRFSGFYRTMLFLPSVVSPIIMTMMYSYFVDRAVPELIQKLFKKEVGGLLSSLNTQLEAVLFYNVLMGFGVQILMYANAMSNINDSIVEACRLDGANAFHEFLHITLPSIWPTLTTFLVVGVAGIFTNQLNLIAFFGTGANVNVQSIGYYLFAKVSVATNSPGGMAEYPVLSALGFMFTVVAVPLTLCIKYLLEHFGPTEE